MRIVSGTHKGRRFSPPPGFKARPTTDFAKENLFNVLNNYIDFESISVLDLFSGTGSISFEFASRGCAQITSVELEPKHYAFIGKVTNELHLQNKITLVRSDVFKYIGKSTLSFDVIFADPPFDMERASMLPDLILGGKLLKPGGVLILEHSDKVSYMDHPHLQQVRQYGKVNFSFFSTDPDWGNA